MLMIASQASCCELGMWKDEKNGVDVFCFSECLARTINRLGKQDMAGSQSSSRELMQKTRPEDER
jgi:hypothetical protein